MGFFSRVNKIWSGLDFLDKEENKAQRQQFAKDDEEERRRKREQATRVAVTQPGVPGRPQQQSQDQTQPEVDKPLLRAGSQSDIKKPELPAYKSVFEQLGDKLEANSPQDIAKREAKGGPRLYQGSKFGEKGVSFKDAEKELISIGRSIVRTPEKLVRSVDANSNQSAIDDINAVLEGKADKADIFKATENNGSFISKMFNNDKNTYTAADRDKLIKIKEDLTRRKNASPENKGVKRFLYGSEPVDTLQQETDKEEQAIKEGGGLVSVIPDWIPGAEKLKKYARENPEVAAQLQIGGFTALDLAGGIGAKKGGEAGIERLAKSKIDDLVESQIDNVAESQVDDVAEKIAEDAPKISGSRPVPRVDTPSVEIAPGVKSTNIPKVQAEVVNDVASTADDLGRRVDLTDLNQVDDLGRKVDLTGLNDGVPKVVPRPAMQSIPDPTSPIALPKVPEQLVDQAPIANFTRGIDAEAPLQKIDDLAPPVDELIVPPQVEDVAQVDELGNPVITSDVVAQRQLADEGIVPARGDSPVGANENMLAREAEAAVRDQVDLADTTAPRTRQQLMDDVNDPILQGEMADGATQKEVVNLQNAKNTGLSRVNTADETQLMQEYNAPFRLQGPEDGYAALAAKDRLTRINTPEARQAVVNITNAIADKSNESGLWLRFSQTLFSDMPPESKADFLIDKLNKAGASFGDQTDEVRAELLRRVELADGADMKLRQVDDLIEETKNQVASGVISGDEADAIAQKLLQARSQLDDAVKVANGDVMQYFDEQIPKGNLGARVGRAQRLAMLTSPFGRAFDLIATTGSAIARTADTAGTALLGKLGNKIKGAGTFEDTLPSLTEPFKNAPGALKKVKGDWSGKRRVDDIFEELQRKSRSDIKQVSGPVSQKVKAVVETPTELTRYVQDEALRSKGMQEAKKLGLPEQEAGAFADLYKVSANEADKYAARQDWFKVNAIHDNKLSNGLNLVAKQLDEVGNGWGNILRNLTAPFTSFFGGNANLAFKDRNVVYNAFSAARNFKRGNPQEALKDLGRLGTNSAAAIAASTLLAQTGILTDKDANGDSYDGVYINIGDRYIPVAASGQFAPALILGYSLNKGFGADNPVDGVMDVVGNTLAGVLKSTDVASTFAGDNSLMQRFGDLSAIATGEDDTGTKVFETGAKLAGDVVRQFIPSASGDANSFVDNYTDLNPTREAPETKATKENPATGRQITDVIPTELNKIKSRIPFLSQGLDRKEGVTAKDPVDRILKSTRANAEATQKRNEDESLKDVEKRLRKDKVPIKDEDIKNAVEDGEYDKALQGLDYKLQKAESESDKKKVRQEIAKTTLKRDDISTEEKGIKARVERGEYDKAIKGYQYKLDNADNDTPESEKKAMETEVKRLEITRDGGYDPEVIALYQSTGVELWRQMTDPDHENYDAETAGLLQEYDAKMAEAGVSKGKKPEKPKYTAKTSGSGRGRGRGSGGKSASKGSYSIATQSLKGGFQPLKARAASYSAPKSAIPKLEKVPNNDSSKLKKISVTKGGRS